MIRHFLAQDFRDSIVGWIIFATLTFLLTLSYLVWQNPYFVYSLGYSCFMFSIFQSTNLVGSVVRSDHILSRHYYLTLPIKKQRMFYLVILRLSIFFFPIWFFCTVIAPLTLRSDFSPIISTVSCYSTYVLGVTTGILWFLGQMLRQTVIWEQSLHFSSSRKRILSGLIPTFVSMLEISILFISFYFPIMIFSSPEKTWLGLASAIFISIPLPVLLTGIKLRLARSRWTSLG